MPPFTTCLITNHFLAVVPLQDFHRVGNRDSLARQ
jgi:hypothetical protein